MNSTPTQMFPDRRADFEGAASRYSQMLFRIALRRLRNVEDAQDAVQDALLSAFKHIGQFESRSQLSSWLTRIVINAAGMKLRRRPQQEAISLDQAPEDGGTTLADELADTRPDPETICVRTEKEELIRGALGRISPKLRVAFEMREMAGLSAREAATALGTTPNTLKSRLSRARKAVRLSLEKVSQTRPADKALAPIVSRTPNHSRGRNFGRRYARFTNASRELATPRHAAHAASR